MVGGLVARDSLLTGHGMQRAVPSTPGWLVDVLFQGFITC